MWIHLYELVGFYNAAFTNGAYYSRINCLKSPFPYSWIMCLKFKSINFFEWILMRKEMGKFMQSKENYSSGCLGSCRSCKVFLLVNLNYNYLVSEFILKYCSCVLLTGFLDMSIKEIYVLIQCSRTLCQMLVPRFLRSKYYLDSIITTSKQTTRSCDRRENEYQSGSVVSINWRQKSIAYWLTVCNSCW